MQELTCLLRLIPLNPGILAVIKTSQCITNNLERLRLLTNSDNLTRLY